MCSYVPRRHLEDQHAPAVGREQPVRGAARGRALRQRLEPDQEVKSGEQGLGAGTERGDAFYHYLENRFEIRLLEWSFCYHYIPKLISFDIR